MSIIRTFVAAILSLFGMALTIPVIVCGLPFWVVAFLSRFIYARLSSLKSRIVPWQQLIEYEPIVGWKPKANLNAYAYADKVFHLTTDAQGWRGKTTLRESDIVVFGDSYAFGYGVSDKFFFAELNPKVRIKTISANGYNMVQALLWMRQLSADLSGKVVVWFIYFGNDLYENLQPNLDQYRMPFVRTANGADNWEIVTSHVSPAKWFSNSERDYYGKLAEICSSTFLSQRACSACEFLIRQGRDACDRAGARLVVMTIPDITQISESHMERLAMLARDPESFDPDLPDIRIREICGNLSVPFITLKEHLGVQDHKEHDAHWNERGHKRVAQVLYDLYCDHAPSEATLSSSRSARMSTVGASG